MKINNVNENILKDKTFNLRKIALTLGLASSLLFLTGCGTSIEQADSKYINEEEMNNEEMKIYASLQGYRSAYDNYEEKQDVQSRVKLIEETKKLSKIADNLIETKINDALGTNYEIKVNTTDGNRTLTGDSSLLDCNFPMEMNELVNSKDFIDSNIYKGDGSSDAWNNEINGFNKKGLKLYEEIVKNIDKDFEIDGKDIKVAKNQEQAHK